MWFMSAIQYISDVVIYIKHTQYSHTLCEIYIVHASSMPHIQVGAGMRGGRKTTAGLFSGVE